ncbi:MAG: tail fiber protein [Bacillota bacterium]|nr:tail fiber protein [Bacillota bacterium]
MSNKTTNMQLYKADPVADKDSTFNIDVLLNNNWDLVDSFFQNLLENLNTHKSGSDHDNRYFTETELGAISSGAAGADKIGATAVSGYTGTTVQSILAAIGAALTAHKSSGDHDTKYYTQAVVGSTTSGSSGADKVGATAISGYTGTTVQAILTAIGAALTTHKSSGDHDTKYYTQTVMGSTTSGSSGADKVGATAVSGYAGTTVQAILAALGAALAAHKTSTDHDSRYFTETELGDTTSGSSGAGKIGVTAISGLTGATVQAILEALKAFGDTTNTNLTTHKSSGDHDGRYFTQTTLSSTTSGSSGADKIGAATVSGYVGNTVQAILAAIGAALAAHKTSTDHDSRYFTETELGDTTSGSSGAGKIGVTAISGLTGATVQALLEALKAFIDTTNTNLATHKTSGDHDARYFTQAVLSSVTGGAAGADKIGVTAITGLTGATVQAILEAMKAFIDTTNSSLTTHKTSGDHDTRYYTQTVLGSTTSGSSGADKIGASSIAGITGNTVQALLQGLKQYVDAVKQSLDPKDSVRAATTGADINAAYNNTAGTLTSNVSAAAVYDGVTLAVGDRVLVKDQTTQAQNGIYTVTNAGSSTTAYVLTRAADADTGAKLTSGSYVWVEQGTTYGDSGWIMTQNGNITIGTTAITWTQFSGAGQIIAGTGLTKSGNTLSITTGGVTAAQLAAGAGTDTIIGSRTLVDTTAPSADSAVLTTILSNLAYMIKSVTGKASWRTLPTATLEDLNNNKLNKAGDTMTGALTMNNGQALVFKDALGGTNTKLTLQSDNNLVLYGTDNNNNQLPLFSVQQRAASRDAIFNNVGSIKLGSNTVWHTGNDGHNSGLDADTLDTYQATDFYKYRGFLTTNSSISYAGQWTKIASVDIVAQFQDGQALIEFIDCANGSSNTQKGRLYFRVKQQNALGSAPGIDLELTDNDTLTKDCFAAVTTVNTTTQTTVELYIKNLYAYSQIVFNPLITALNIKFYELQPFIAALPTGTQTLCTYLPINHDLKVNGVITASLSGNASTATKLAASKTIALSGDATGSATFDGSSDISIAVTVADDSHNHIIDNVDGLKDAIVPSGQVAYFARNTAPSGWLKANGAAVSRSTYAALFSAIGTTFGAGDGSTTFNLPDLRGQFIRSWDDGVGVDASRVFASSQSDGIGYHKHGFRVVQSGWTPNNSGTLTAIGGGDSTYGSGGYLYFPSSTNQYDAYTPSANETRPKNIALLACIKY